MVGAEPAANRNRVRAGGNELAGVCMPERVQTYRWQPAFSQSADPFPRGGIRAPCRALPARKNEIAIAGTAEPQLEPLGLLSRPVRRAGDQSEDRRGTGPPGASASPTSRRRGHRIGIICCNATLSGFGTKRTSRD